MRDLCRMFLYIGIISTISAFSVPPTYSTRKIAGTCHPSIYCSSISTKTINTGSLSSVSSEDRKLVQNTYHRRLGSWIQQGADNALLATVVVAMSFLVAVLPAMADEYGVEKEAPTLFTGETVEICTKRGPLGACLKTELRTKDNDNDVANKYFRDPSALIQRQKTAILQSSDDVDSNELIQKLRQQSVDNREKNELYVARKTFEADQSATFGPFDRQVLIMNTDGKTYTLLENPVAMRLKKAGFIDNQRGFIKQPTQSDLDAATVSEPGFFGGLLGSGGN